MPSGPPELHEKWSNADNGSGDFNAINYLKRAGYKLEGWFWVKPTETHEMTEEEQSAIHYLIVEWDFGGLKCNQ